MFPFFIYSGIYKLYFVTVDYNMKVNISTLRKLIREQIDAIENDIDVDRPTKVSVPGFAGKDMRSFLSNWDEIKQEYEELGLEPPELEDWEEYDGERGTLERAR